MFKLSSKLLLAALFLFLAPALADEPVPGQTKGPATVKLGSDLATMNLPEGYVFYDAATTKEILKRTGNVPDDNELGCVVLDSEKETFWVVISFEDIGYVKDDDAGDINADELLESFKEGTKQANEERKKMGVSPLELEGWGEKPRYEKASHHVVWALRAKSKEGQVVNFNTRVLGRTGVMSLNLICDPNDLERYKPKIETLLGKTNYVDGKRYADYKDGDKVSDLGILALIAGGAAAAKLGLFAKLFKFLLYILVAGKKLIIVAFVAIGGFFKKMFGRGGSEPDSETTVDPPTPSEDPPNLS